MIIPEFCPNCKENNTPLVTLNTIICDVCGFVSSFDKSFGSEKERKLLGVSDTVRATRPDEYGKSGSNEASPPTRLPSEKPEDLMKAK